MAVSTVTPFLSSIQRLNWHVAHDDSMAPAINLGDEFGFCPFEQQPGDAELVDGAVYALDLDGERMVRRVFMTAKRMRLQADNPDFAPIDLTLAEAEQRGLWIAGRVQRVEGRVSDERVIAAGEVD